MPKPADRTARWMVLALLTGCTSGKVCDIAAGAAGTADTGSTGGATGSKVSYVEGRSHLPVGRLKTAA